MNRRDDARFDAAIHDFMLRVTGVVEPDEPTPYSHARWMERYAQAAREGGRAHLGLGPFADTARGHPGEGTQP